jgi:transcriptional regulator with XRE-family HTH domain
MQHTGRGERIKAQRIDLGLSQQQLADAVGVSRITIRKWEENDLMEIMSSNLENLARALKKEPAWVLHGGVRESAAPSYSPLTPEERQTIDDALSTFVDDVRLGKRRALIAAKLLNALYEL